MVATYNFGSVYTCVLIILKAYISIHERSLADFIDKGRLNNFQYLTGLNGPQEMTYLYSTKILSLNRYQYIIRHT